MKVVESRYSTIIGVDEIGSIIPRRDERYFEVASVEDSSRQWMSSVYLTEDGSTFIARCLEFRVPCG